MGKAIDEQDEIRKVPIASGEWPAYVTVYALQEACGMIYGVLWEW
jgi:hypothetical protein